MRTLAFVLVVFTGITASGEKRTDEVTAVEYRIDRPLEEVSDLRIDKNGKTTFKHTTPLDNCTAHWERRCWKEEESQSIIDTDTVQTIMTSIITSKLLHHQGNNDVFPGSATVTITVEVGGKERKTVQLTESMMHETPQLRAVHQQMEAIIFRVARGTCL